MAKELDFDELDKAVTSLMGGVKDADPDTTEKNLDINATLAPGESPSYNRLHSAAQGIGNEAIDKKEHTVSLTPQPEKVPAENSQKSAGRFMDVVHPSSDMRVPTVRKVSRQGVTIDAPAKIEIPPDVTSASLDTTAGNLPSSSAAGPDEPEVIEDTSAPVEAATLPSAITLPEPIQQPAQAEDVADPSIQPLSSPFLPDAKVEKRPLGGEPNLSTQPRDAADTSPAPVSTPDPSEVPVLEAHEISAINEVKTNDEFSKMDAMAEPAQNLEEVNEHIPEEYQNELLAVEKNIAASLQDEPTSATELSSSPAPAAPVIASIPKQYQEKPSSGDATNGSIYDTDQYHKPLAHPAKEKSGWTWVIAIIALILVGAGLGAAAYYLGLV